ncbi:hypothetical protein [Candidatus Nitrosocosmicus sp. SS]|nr:hypothetical protein [Candidatus Nitrosocosmicus sp. SS]
MSGLENSDFNEPYEKSRCISGAYEGSEEMNAKVGSCYYYKKMIY